MERYDLGHGLTVFQSRASNWRLNCGVLAGEDGVLLIDPGVLPDELAALRAFIGKRPVRWILNTHYHGDHLFGLSAWPDVDRIASASAVQFDMTARRVTHSAARLGEALGVQWDPPVVYLPPTRLIYGAEPLDAVHFPGWQLMHAPGHSPDLLALHHPEAGLLWAGDIVTAPDDYPTLWDGAPTTAIETLLDLIYLRPTAVVPGHGAPAVGAEQANDYICDTYDYLCALRNMVTALAAQGKSMDDAINEELRDAPDAWRDALSMNVRRAWAEATGDPV
jgi:cyclase